MKSTSSLLLLAGLLAAFTSPSRGGDFEAALTSETAQFMVRSDSSVVGWGGAELGLGLFYNEASDFIGIVSLMQRRKSSPQTPLTLGVGARAYIGKLDDIDQDVVAAAISGEIRYTLPGTMPMSIWFEAHYAPKIISFSDTEEVLETNLGFQIEVLPQTTAFAGYRSIDLDVDSSSDYDADDDRIHVGVRFTF